MDQQFTQYPVFEPNQVLTSYHLNDLRDYLEEQVHLTRQTSIGVGIVCGFEIKYDTALDLLRLTAGTGLTSEGHLVSSTELVFNRKRRFRDQAVPSYGFFCERDDDFSALLKVRKDLRKIRGVKTKALLSSKMKLPSLPKQFRPIMPLRPPMFFADELLTPDFQFDKDNDENKSPIRHLRDADVVDKVLMLYLEKRDIELKNCDLNDCNERGAKRDFRLRFLVIDQRTARSIRLREKGCNSFAVNPRDLPQMSIGRFNYQIEGLSSYRSIFNRYNLLIDQAVDEIVKNLKASYNILQPYLTGLYAGGISSHFINTVQHLPTLLRDFSNSNHWGAQYRYSFLRDLVEAYDEFRNHALKFISTCCPDDDIFPMHLMAGIIRPISGSVPLPGSGATLLPPTPIFDEYNPEKLISDYRHSFSPPNQDQAHPMLKEKVRSLHYRMYQMILNFNKAITGQQNLEIRITPSAHKNSTLSNKAIPFYYYLNKRDHILRKNWSFDRTINRELDQVVSYHLPDADRNLPLQVSQLQNDFYRIEGHLGKSIENAVASIEKQKKKLGLSFNTVAIKVGSRPGVKDLSNYSFHFDDLESLFHTTKSRLKGKIKNVSDFIGNIEISEKITDSVKPPREYFAGEIFEVFPFKLPVFQIGFPQVMGAATEPDPVEVTGDTPSTAFQTVKYERVTSTSPSAFGTIHKETQSLLREDYPLESVIQDRLPGLIGKAEPELVSSIQQWSTQVIRLLDDLELLQNSLETDALRFFNNQNFQSSHRRMLVSAGTLKEKITKGKLKADIDLIEIQKVLDDLLQDDNAHALDAIYREREKRATKLKEAFVYTRYKDKNPGLEHWGGVPEGGTFVLIYYDRDIPIPIPPLRPMPLPDLPGIVPGKLDANIIPDRFELVEVLKGYMTGGEIEVDDASEDTQTLAEGLADEFMMEATGKAGSVPILHSISARMKVSDNLSMQVREMKEKTELEKRDFEEAMYCGKSKFVMKVEGLRSNFGPFMSWLVQKQSIKSVGLVKPFTPETLKLIQPASVLTPLLPPSLKPPEVRPRPIPLPELGDRLFNLNEGQVLADFCLPYMCCSDLPPVSYMFQEPEIELKTDQKLYCKSDKSRHLIQVNPKGGRILENIPDLQNEPDGNYSFVPAKLPVRDNNRITYEVGSIRKEIYIPVISPDASFKLESVKADKNKKSLTATFLPLQFDPKINYWWEVFRQYGKKVNWKLIDSSSDPTYSFKVSAIDSLFMFPNLKVQLTATISGEVKCTAAEFKQYTIQQLLKFANKLDLGEVNLGKARIKDFLDELAAGSEILDKLPKSRRDLVRNFTESMKDRLEKSSEVDKLKEGKATEKVTKEIEHMLGYLRNDLITRPGLDEETKMAYASMYDKVTEVGDAVLKIQDEEIEDENTRKKSEKALSDLNSVIKKDIDSIKKVTKKEFGRDTFIGSSSIITGMGDRFGMVGSPRITPSGGTARPGRFSFPG